MLFFRISLRILTRSQRSRITKIAPTSTIFFSLNPKTERPEFRKFCFRIDHLRHAICKALYSLSLSFIFDRSSFSTPLLIKSEPLIACYALHGNDSCRIQNRRNQNDNNEGNAEVFQYKLIYLFQTKLRRSISFCFFIDLRDANYF